MQQLPFLPSCYPQIWYSKVQWTRKWVNYRVYPSPSLSLGITVSNVNSQGLHPILTASTPHSDSLLHSFCITHFLCGKSRSRWKLCGQNTCRSLLIGAARATGKDVWKRPGKLKVTVNKMWAYQYRYMRWQGCCLLPVKSSFQDFFLKDGLFLKNIAGAAVTEQAFFQSRRNMG